MAKRKSRTRNKTSRLSAIVWSLMAFVSSGGIGAYLNPDWPIIGPLVQSLQSGGIERVVEALPKDSGTILEALAERRGLTQAAQGIGNEVFPTRFTSSPRSNDKLLIATFNIQVFGASKMAKREVVEVLVEVVRQFDIVAIQEVRAQSDEILPSFLAAINSNGSRYNFLIGPRLGRSNSTEQYAYIYDTNRVEHDPTSIGTVGDPNDLMHREPFVARFRPRLNTPAQAFTFWMVNIHTDPDEVKQEVDALADVFQLMQSARPDEDDVILLGDLNASETQLGRLGQIPGINWVVKNAMTNTRQNKAYDNIIFDGPRTSEYTGRWGIIDLEGQFGITREQAIQVSDHLPVWAEFHILEAPQQGNFADRSRGLQR